MSKNWEGDVGNPNTRDTPQVGQSSKDYSEHYANLPQQESQHVPRHQDNTNPSTNGWTSKEYSNWAAQNPGQKLPQQEEESKLSKEIQAHQDAIKKRDEELALKRKQEEVERQKQQKQQEQLDFEKRIQTAYLYKMEKPKIRDNCLVKIGDKKQTVKQGVIWNIEKNYFRSNKYTVKLKDDGTTVIVDKVYTLYPSGGRRRKSKKLCKMQKSRKSRRSSQSKGNSRRSRGSLSR